jgi:hypothetical protein
MSKKALERPNYLTKPQEQKFWNVWTYEVQDGGEIISRHIFIDKKEAIKFASESNGDFDEECYYSTIEEIKKERGVKHF